MSNRHYYQGEGGKLRMGVGWWLVIMSVTSLGLWWTMIYMAISWLWK